jgi:hypothetical protein
MIKNMSAIRYLPIAENMLKELVNDVGIEKFRYDKDTQKEALVKLNHKMGCSLDNVWMMKQIDNMVKDEEHVLRLERTIPPPCGKWTTQLNACIPENIPGWANSLSLAVEAYHERIDGKHCIKSELWYNKCQQKSRIHGLKLSISKNWSNLRDIPFNKLAIMSTGELKNFGCRPLVPSQTQHVPTILRVVSPLNESSGDWASRGLWRDSH